MAEYIIDTSELSGIDESWLAKHEQIIRCRDCIFYIPYHGSCFRRTEHPMPIEPDGFCRLGVSE